MAINSVIQPALLVDQNGNPLILASGAIPASLTGPLGRSADAASVSAALSTENVAILGATNESAPASDTASSGLNGRLQRLAQNITTLIGRFPGAAAMADAVANMTTTIVGAANLLFNGSTWDRWTNNIEATILSSTARTTQTASADQTNYNCRGAMFYLNITSASGTGGLTFILQTKDPTSGQYYTIFTAGAAQTTTGQKGYLIYPGAASGNDGNILTTYQRALPRTYRVLINVGDSSSYTYSVGVSYIV